MTPYKVSLEVLDQYKSLLHQMLIDLERGVRIKDWEEVRGIAHRIKGNASLYGFPQVSSLAGHLLLALEELDESEMISGVALLQRACQEVLRD